jgi:hypothetical protein
MCRLCWTMVILLALVAGGMAYKFIVQGSVEQGTDGRSAIQVNPGEKDLVLTEMRAFLQAVQGITAGLSNNDIENVIKNARSVGMAAQQAVPGSLVGKLPLAFKKLGFDTHTRFDTLALNAEQFGDPGDILKELSRLMENCVACHAAYRLDTDTQ